MTGLDFTQPKHVEFSAAVQLVIDAAMQAKQAAEDAKVAADPRYQRPAIGVGGLGNDCMRALGYEYHRVPKDVERATKPGKLLRIFKRGHDAEANMAEWLKLAGFTMLTKDERGRQFRFDDAPYEDGKGRIKGMVDGVITAGPAELVTSYQESPEHPAKRFQLNYPMLWENKEVNNKKFNLFMKKGVRDVEIDYFTQAQMLMAHFNLSSCLFTAKNADSQEIFAELIQFDPRFAQAASDKAVRVISSRHAEELSRIAQAPDDFRCKFCDWPGRCWRKPELADLFKKDKDPRAPSVLFFTDKTGNLYEFDGEQVSQINADPVPNATRPAWLTPPQPAGPPKPLYGYARRKAWIEHQQELGREAAVRGEPPIRTLSFTGDRGYRKP